MTVPTKAGPGGMRLDVSVDLDAMPADQRVLLQFEHQILELLTSVARHRIQLARRERGLPPAATEEAAAIWPDDLIELGVAAQIAHRPSDTVRSWARRHQIGTPAGFAIRLRGRWFASRKLFMEFLQAKD